MGRIVAPLYGLASNAPSAPEERGRTAKGAPRHDKQSLFVCPLTGQRCEGDLAYLCEDYGCARKAGLSPHSAENL